MTPRVWLLSRLSLETWTPIAEIAAEARALGFRCRAVQGALTYLLQVGAVERERTSDGPKPAYRWRLSEGPRLARRPSRCAKVSRAGAELQRAAMRAAALAEPARVWTVDELAATVGCSVETAGRRVDNLVGEGLLEDVSESGHRRLALRRRRQVA